MNYISLALFSSVFNGPQLIGYKTKENNFILPWQNKAFVEDLENIKEFIDYDMKFFVNLTKNNFVIMGSNTFKSLPEKVFENSRGRTFVVITSKVNLDNIIILKDNSKIAFVSMEKAFSFLRLTAKNPNVHSVVIGGASIIEQIISSNATLIDKIYLARYIGFDLDKQEENLTPIYISSSLYDLAIVNNEPSINLITHICSPDEKYEYHLLETSFNK